MSLKKSPFIEGFREPTLSRNPHFLLADVRGDGEGKLVIWSEDSNKLIVYKGSNRQLEKPCKLRNVSAMIEYYDEESSVEPAIGLAAQNAFYIFRGLVESFRLRVPDVIATEQEQLIWSKYVDNPTELQVQLRNLKPSLLTEKARYFIGASSEEQRKQLLQKIFEEGISEKDSISTVTLIKQTDSVGVGNVVLGTELNRLYILDNYGHRIINERIIEFAPCIMFAYGRYESKYVVICVSREGVISLFVNTDKDEPSQSIRLNSRVTCGDFSFPDLSIVTADNIVSMFSLSNSNFKISVPKLSFKLSMRPLKLLYMKKKGARLLLLCCENEFRIMRGKETIYRYETDFKLYSMIYGSFAREESCLILMYQKNGFEVLIGHRLFNPKENYETRKAAAAEQAEEKKLELPKKTEEFLKYWNSKADDSSKLKIFEKSMRILKWRTLKARLSQKIQNTAKIEVNPKVLGLGPDFIVRLQIQNLSNTAIYGVKMVVTCNEDRVELTQPASGIDLLAPFTPIMKEIRVRSLSLEPERFRVDLSWHQNLCSNIVCLPGCAEFQE